MREKAARTNLRHGESRQTGMSAEYRCLSGMRERCFNPNNAAYMNYGGRGITICDRWRHGNGSQTAIECFIDDMGRRPSARHSIDRIDNDGNYEPGNCQWVSRKVQANNRRPGLIVARSQRRVASKITADQAESIKRKRLVDGLPLRDIADEFGISAQLVCDIARGRRWSHVEVRPC
jgi:hypothetical protein